MAITKTVTGSVAAASTEPVTLDEAKLHLGIDGTDSDALITALIQAAREYAETFTRRKFMTTTLTQKLDEFADEMRLRRPPLVSATIAYIDADGDSQTLSSATYTVDTSVEPGRILLAYGQSWPSVRDQANAITVTYVAGYGDAGDVPEGIKAAIKLLVGHWFANREAVADGRLTAVPLAVESLLWQFRVLEAA